MPAANSGPRVFVRFPQEQYDQFQKWSRQLGVPMTYLVSMCAWTGSHIVIPKMLPDVQEHLELIKESKELEHWQAQAEILADINQEDRKLFEEFESHREEILQWVKQRGLHNDES